jgi:hypothetical protein
MQRLEKTVSVKNTSTKEQRLVDLAFEKFFAPGEVAEIPSVVWLRNMRLSWLARSHKPDVSEEKPTKRGKQTEQVSHSFS